MKKKFKLNGNFVCDWKVERKLRLREVKSFREGRNLFINWMKFNEMLNV
ncbi:MAG: hypothetical protein ACTS5F_01680 [Candidatus Hodgkinia cicadicola]